MSNYDEIKGRDGLVCVTGAKRATPYGLALAEMAGRVVAELGLTLATCAARGCEAEAARAALGHGGDVLLLAPGDEPYPKSSSDVYERAEVLWGDGPVTRYSLIGLRHALAEACRVTVVCEAGVPSGIFTQADRAMLAGNDVLAFPGSVFSPQSRGANELIAHGCRAVTSEASLIQALRRAFALPEYGKNYVPRNGATFVHPILSALSASPMRPDEISERLGLSATEALKALAEHEANGSVVRLPDGRYSLTGRAYKEGR